MIFVRLRRTRGSFITRYTHSIPTFWKLSGARMTVPTIVSKVPPMPMKTLTPNLSAWASIHFSCLGLPSAAKRMSSFRFVDTLDKFVHSVFFKVPVLTADNLNAWAPFFQFFLQRYG